MSLVPLKSSRLHLVLKHLIKLDEGSILCLGEFEPKDDQCDDASRGEDEASLSQESSTVWFRVEHVGCDDVPNAGPEIVEAQADGLRFGSKSCRGDLACCGHCGPNSARDTEPQELETYADCPVGC